MSGRRSPSTEEQWRDWLVRRLSALLRRPITGHDLNRPLHEFGVSSRDAITLAAELGELAGREVSSTLVWTAPTITELAGALADGSAYRGPRAESGAAGRSGPGEAVAIVGVGCRFPGAAGAAGFWSLLTGGESVVGELPGDRWAQFGVGRQADGVSRYGAFLEDIAGFDAEFFGISPREAELMDPQQRLLLEVTWEALADAGVPPESLRGTDCGVFVGLAATEYAQLTMTDLERIDAWSATGAAASLAANRISYTLGVHGPSVTVDTACSSSLVSVHQAMRALTSGDAAVAVAGGVNLLLSPSITANFQLAGLLAADGRCKPFDAAADGIVRGEGCGVVVLKRLADARRAGDRILAVIRGGAINSDGRSNGIMAPNPVAQQRLLAKAYAEAGVSPRTVDYVEAHGTGTLLGDPIEAGALASVLGSERSARRPLLLGSVKSNIGHLEGAAGIAGLIKVVLALRHGRIPASLNFREPNPHIDFAGGRLSIVTGTTEWPRYPGVARAGVSSFGFGGTNAHLVVEEWPHPVAGRPDERPAIVPLSARSPERLRDRARALAGHVDDRVPVTDVAAALLHGDGQGPVRAAIPARDHAELRERLRLLAGGTPDRSVPTGEGAPDGPVFVFSGYGSQWPDMARGLLAAEPAFAEAVRALDGPFRARVGVAFSAILRGEPVDAPPFAVRQSTLFGMQVALAALWRGYGVRPAAVLGHSMGEVAAAVATGALAPEDGLRVMWERSVLLDELDRTGAGAMAAVELSPGELAEMNGRFAGVGVAVYASPHQCTVSGPVDKVRDLVSFVEGRGGLARLLPVGVAGHSAALDPLLGRLREALDDLEPHAPAADCYSTVLDDPRQRPAFDPAYWVANLRSPVRFTQALAAAMRDGHRTFVEVSPHPIAHVAIEQTAASLGDADVTVIPSLHRTEPTGFAAALAALYAAGHPEPLRRRYPNRMVVDLPPPSWRHQRFWVSARPARAHPFLGERVDLPGTERRLWRAEVGTSAHPWLAARTVHGVPVLPAAVLLELMLAAAREVLPRQENIELRELTFDRLLPLAGTTEVSVTAEPGPDHTVSVTVHARADEDSWASYAGATAATIATVPGPVPGERVETELPAALDRSRYTLHPELAEACLLALAGAPGVRLTRLDRVVLTGDPRHATTVVAHRNQVQVLDSGGVLLAVIEGARFAEVPRSEVPCLPEHLAYQAEWRPEEGKPMDLVRPGRWLLLPGEGAQTRRHAAAIADRLAAEGQHAVLLPKNRRAELTDLADGAAGVVLLPGSPGSPAALDAARELVLSVAGTVRDLTTVDGQPPRLWLATRKATTVRAGEAGRPATAALRGLIRVVAFEHPELRASMVDLPGDSTSELVGELLADGPDDEVAFRDGIRFTRTLTRAALPAPDGAAPTVRDGAYLITGGLGGLGIAAARWLARRGATRIVLSARRRPGVAAGNAIAALRASGTEIVVRTGDIAEPGTAEALVGAATEGGLPLRGVLHAAGVLADGAVLTLRPDHLRTAWRAKTEGALRLHDACAGHELDWWLAYSSAAGLFGSPGQAAYATANAWLDAFAGWRRGQGLPATTIQWGAWAEIGGAAGKPNPILEPMPPGEGIAALAAVLGSGRGETAITRLNPSTVRELFPRIADRPFFAELADAEPAETEAGPLPGIESLRTLAEEDPGRARAVIGDHLRSVVAGMMGLDPGLLDPHAPLTSLGLDSLLAMRARGAVERDFGSTLPLPLLLRGASLDDLAGHLAGELTGSPVVTVSASSGPSTRDIAERWVARMWRQVLGAGEFPVTVPFTEACADDTAGPDDTAAERLRAAISAELGREVGAAELFATPTIAGMADVVRADLVGGDTGSVRWLGGDENSPPVFLFHAAGSPTAVYQPLIRLLDAEVACYGMERLDEVATVPEKAERYARLIRERQPDGPYRLGGWSFGGMLAFETARRLTALGAEVELLFLIDSILPLPDDEVSPDDAGQARLRRFIEYVEQTYQVDLDLPAAALTGLSESERSALVMRRLAERVAAMGDAVLEHQQTSYVDAQISERYQPGHYAGAVLLFRAKDPHPLTTTLDPRYLRSDDALGWDEFCGDLEVVRVPGDHITVIDPPHVAMIADRLSALLRR